MTSVKITSVGGSLGVELPEAITKRLGVGLGDTLNVLETLRGIEITPYRPEFVDQTAIAETVMNEDRDALRKLAD